MDLNKRLENILYRDISYKHLRGRHNQLDHAWNRGMGKSGNITTSEYRKIIKHLDDKVALGEITQQENDLTRANIRKKVQESISAQSTRNTNTKREIISEALTSRRISASDIAAASQNMSLANVNSMPSRPIDGFPIFNLAYLRKLKYSDEKEFLNLIQTYRDLGLSHEDAAWKVYGIAQKLENQQGIEYARMEFYNAALPYSESAKNKPDLPELLSTDRSPMQAADDVVNLAKQLEEDYQKSRIRVPSKNSLRDNFLKALQSLTPTEQMHVITNPESREKLESYVGKYRTLANMAVAGAPETREYVNKLADYEKNPYDIERVRNESIEYLIEQGRKYGWQWFAAEIVTTHVINDTGFKTAAIQELMANIGPNASILRKPSTSFYPKLMSIPDINKDALEALQKTYEAQQEVFAQLGEQYSNLHRASKITLGIPMESWTTSYAAAKQFEKRDGLAILNSKKVDVRNIFARHDTLPGWPIGFYADEFESIVLGMANVKR